MEARASFSGSPVSKTFVAGTLVLVAMGLAAMGGYVAKGLTGSGAAASQSVTAHAAPGTVVRQDNPNAHPASEAGRVGKESRPRRAPRHYKNNQYFIGQC